MLDSLYRISDYKEVDTIRFKFSAVKAFVAIQWMLQQRQRLDLHAILKTCYFADKAHLNEFGRPIFGATYRAMRFGPVPIEVYEMLKGESLWLAELETDRYPWVLEGYTIRLTDNAPPIWIAFLNLTLNAWATLSRNLFI